MHSETAMFYLFIMANLKNTIVCGAIASILAATSALADTVKVYYQSAEIISYEADADDERSFSMKLNIDGAENNHIVSQEAKTCDLSVGDTIEVVLANQLPLYETFEQTFEAKASWWEKTQAGLASGIGYETGDTIVAINGCYNIIADIEEILVNEIERLNNK